jgi:SAM-dependent methyltransferase
VSEINKEHFSKEDIDSIKCDRDNNYFTPVLSAVLQKTGALKNVLDVGCGNGIFSSSLKFNTSCKLTGIDGSQYALSVAKNLDFDRLEKISDFSNDQLPFNDGEFDFVICKDVLEHLIDPKHCVDEIVRIVNKSGYVLIHVPNHFPILGRFKLLFQNNIDPFNYFPNSSRWNFPHIRFYTKSSILELCSKMSLVGQYNEYFISLPFLSRFIPMGIKRFLANKHTDLFSESVTLLFKK